MSVLKFETLDDALIIAHSNDVYLMRVKRDANPYLVCLTGDPDSYWKVSKETFERLAEIMQRPSPRYLPWPDAPPYAGPEWRVTADDITAISSRRGEPPSPSEESDAAFDARMERGS